MSNGPSSPAPRYRLLHSSGEVVFADRSLALDWLRLLPGAKLFVLAAP